MFDFDPAAQLTYWLALVAGTELPTLAERLEDLRPAWMRDGAYRGNGHRVFFPTVECRRRAPRPSAACGVRGECLAYALADPELQDVWGGTSEQERRALRRAAA